MSKYGKIKIKIAGVTEDSTVDGPGIRLVVFTQGCPFECDGCHNPDARPMTGGSEISVSEILERIKRNPLTDGITFSGGEPFIQAQALTILAREVHKLGLNVVTYTGYTFEEIIAGEPNYHELLHESDYVVDGQYIQALHKDDLPFRGSSNQRIIDVKKSLADSGKACVLTGF